MLVGMSSIWSGSIQREINDFDVISICQYAQSMCGGPYAFAKYIFLSGKKLPQKTINGILTSSTTCYIRHMCFLNLITISQYHDIDISYIDIDFSKNAFSMTLLDVGSHIQVEIYDSKKLWIYMGTMYTCLCNLKIKGNK